jgi:lytic murein transglycosylase
LEIPVVVVIAGISAQSAAQPGVEPCLGRLSEIVTVGDTGEVRRFRLGSAGLSNDGPSHAIQAIPSINFGPPGQFMNGKIFMLRFAIVLAALTLATPGFAARCGGDFNTFVAAMSTEAQAAGISSSVVSSALGGVQQDMAVLNFDRRQRGTFNKTFEQYVSTRVGPGRINTGRAMLQRHAALLSSIEQRFGVPRQIIVAIWGLETDFGKGDMGKLPVFRVLATMAHDCRRTELFQTELLSALKIVQRGDLRLGDMIGAYAGEIGQTQFLPSSYIKYGVDFDGNGHVDLRHSVPDVLASTANLLHTSGFKMGAPYGEGTTNFEAMREWNRATIYRKTIGYFADQLVGR